MAREEDSEVHTDIALLSNRLDNVVDSQQQTRATIERMATSMEKFAEHVARREERDDRQFEFNRKIEAAQENMFERIRLLEDARARDSDMMSGLRKYWPALILIAIGVMALLPQFLNNARWFVE